MQESIGTESTETPPDSGMDFLDGYIPEAEYARRRGVTLRTCQRDRQLRKAPPYIHLGRRIFYRIDAMRQWLVKNEHTEDQRPGTPKSRRFSQSRFAK